MEGTPRSTEYTIRFQIVWYAFHQDSLAGKREAVARGIDDPERALDRAVERVEPMPPRFLQMLQLLADGLSLNEIAEQRSCAIGTLKNDAKQMRDALGADTTCQAVAMALRRGLIN